MRCFILVDNLRPTDEMLDIAVVRCTIRAIALYSIDITLESEKHYAVLA